MDGRPRVRQILWHRARRLEASRRSTDSEKTGDFLPLRQDESGLDSATFRRRSDAWYGHSQAGRFAGFRGLMFRIGLNPYGLAYTVGLQGAGTARANPQAIGLSGFVDLARQIGAQCIELDWRWLTPLSDAALGRLRGELADMTPVCSFWLSQEHDETLTQAIRLRDGSRVCAGPPSPDAGARRAACGLRFRMANDDRARPRDAAAGGAARR